MLPKSVRQEIQSLRRDLRWSSADKVGDQILTHMLTATCLGKSLKPLLLMLLSWYFAGRKLKPEPRRGTCAPWLAGYAGARTIYALASSPRKGGRKYGSHEKKAALNYSGKESAKLRRERGNAPPKKTAVSEPSPTAQLEAVTELRQLGFLPPFSSHCTSCGANSMSKPVVRRKKEVVTSPASCGDPDFLEVSCLNAKAGCTATLPEVQLQSQGQRPERREVARAIFVFSSLRHCPAQSKQPTSR